MRDVLEVAEPSIIFSELSDLAEACLVLTNSLLGGESLTIIALGKFGGRELNYGADLDVVFIGEDTRPAQNLIAAMTQSSAEGVIASLDARLRPDGEKGPLVVPLAAFESYYRERAQLWEIHALSRARPVSGPLQDAYIHIARKTWRDIGQQSDLFVKIDNMLERIQRERSSGDEFLDFKTGSGGIIEAEFFVQALQMHSGIWEPNWEKAVLALQNLSVISNRDARNATDSYDFLRRTETALRRFENKNISTLPAGPDEQKKVTTWLGHNNVESFAKEYSRAREVIHALYERYIKSKIA
jgi:glutamate-ammonia-ligase adenylyltransferase